MLFSRCPKETTTSDAQHSTQPNTSNSNRLVRAEMKSRNREYNGRGNEQELRGNVSPMSWELWFAMCIGFILGVTTGAIIFGIFPIH
jgi:hypothetical protein